MWSISVPSLPGGKTTGISLRLSIHGGGETRLAARDAGNGIHLTCTDTRGKYSRTYEYERHSILPHVPRRVRQLSHDKAREEPCNHVITVRSLDGRTP